MSFGRQPRKRTRKYDKRYSTRRWQAVREQVLRRDLYRCQVVPGCPDDGNVADHINPVYEGMPDWEFYDPLNLRASCQWHNKALGAVARLARERGESVSITPRSYQYGGSVVRARQYGGSVMRVGRF